jgi:hypothetical protein
VANEIARLCNERDDPRYIRSVDRPAEHGAGTRCTKGCRCNVCRSARGRTQRKAAR